MRIFLKIFIITFSFQSFAVCEFKKEYKNVVSLSGSATVILQEIGLLSKVSGISVFNPIKNFSGKLYPGGIFLSQNSLSGFDHGIVFYDESRDLTKILNSRKSIRAVEIKTRNQVPMDSILHTMSILKPFLNQCEKEFESVLKKASSLQNEILGLLGNKQNYVFFLGEFKGEKYPELVMVHDGVVKWLIDIKKIKSYPSTLSYVNWSAKLMNEMPKDTIFVALKDSAGNFEKKVSIKGNRISLIYPGVLVPGLTQLEGFRFLFRELQ